MSPMGCYLIFQPQSRVGPMPSSSWSTENELHVCVCVSVVFVLVIFFKYFMKYDCDFS